MHSRQNGVFSDKIIKIIAQDYCHFYFSWKDNKIRNLCDQNFFHKIFKKFQENIYKKKTRNPQTIIRIIKITWWWSTLKPDLTAETQRRRSPISLLTAHLAAWIYLHCSVKYHICCRICIFIALSNAIFVLVSVLALDCQMPYLF